MGNIIACGSITLIMVALLFTIPLYEVVYFQALDSKTNQVNFFFNTLAFAIGVSITSLFYREIGGNIGKGILLGNTFFEEELKDDNSPYSQTLRQSVSKASIIGQQYSHNLTFILDFQNLLVTIVSCTILLSGEKDEFHKTTLYLILFILSFNILLSTGISWIVKLIKIKRLTSVYIATQMRLQFIIINVISIIFIYFIAFVIFPKEVTLGDGKGTSFFDSKISKGDVIYCIIQGQFFSFMIILVVELFTSHGHQLTRKISSMVQQYSQGHAFVTAQSQGNFALVILLGLLGISAYEAFFLGGFYGLACVCLGYMQSAAVLLSMGLTSAINNDAYLLAVMNQMEAQIRDRLYLIRWASENFTPFIQSINISAGFLGNLVCIGCIVQLSSSQGNLIYEGTGLLGFILGVGLIYLIKFFNCKCVRDVSIDMVQYIYYLIIGFFLHKYYNINYIKQCLAFMIVTGVLLGKLAIVGFALGMVFISTIDSLNGLIVGTSLKNAKIYINHQEASILAEYQIPSTGLNNYVNFCLLFLAIGAKVFSESGYFNKESVAKGEEATGKFTDWFSTLIGEK
ncbi:proton-pumping vacuolar pyrophosphatase, putative [Ichthyophthirius multifiliis]|uniref:H(+)-exporting diphosphatase n=1 Tax=Ichthyophthirius multifiliis TaxID=5932 RepID=G0R1K6_ICHMU|nr:proton-pumping vacuolar pyrophosphatase, putative [Ichthyophthirius multifiliis]EGR28655.1 proton-pumping vacuolar pyrophosphatase, putative [Ichthyophthirius multifiliis]|eukprot:XP_004029891.1 proton-pumping vacuolar pyrophosphatase, putative [Ichthyophthirius multifiliis]